MDKWWLNRPDDGMATPEVIQEWLNRDTISIWDAALIANGAYPGTDAGLVSKECRDAVYETEGLLGRSTALKRVDTAIEQDLFQIETVFKALENSGHEFPLLVKDALQDRKLISKKRGTWQAVHKNTAINEQKRTQVLHAIIRVLADPELHPKCRKDCEALGEVVGSHLGELIVRLEDRLFPDEKSPRQAGTIAKQFNDIIRTQVN